MIRQFALGIALGMVAWLAHAAPAVGEEPPDFLGTTLKGQDVRVSELRGKVVVVAFWASWCGYCRKQLPLLDAMQRQIGRDRLEVVLVNFKESPRTFRETVRQLKKVTLTVTEDRRGAVSDAYGIIAVPRLFMIGKAGRVGWSSQGYSDEQIPEISAALNRLLAEPSRPEPAAAVPAPAR